MPAGTKNKTAGRTAAGAGPGRRERNKQQTKDKILKVALELFRKKGLEGTTTREIARRCGIGEGTLFNYFRTKEDLALFFFQTATNDVIHWYHREHERELKKAGLAERLFAIVQRQLEFVVPYENFIGAVLFRALQPRSKLSPLSFESQELRLKYLRFIRDVLAEAEEKEEIPRVGELGAYAFGLFYAGILVHWLHDTSKGREKTLALLDRCLQVGTQALNKGAWEW
jgi:AcrR family transcriptional regulator